MKLMKMQRKLRFSPAAAKAGRRMSARVFGLALMGAVVTPVSTGLANQCSAYGKDRASDGVVSIEVRRLQTNLMVAALSCGARADYNAFVINHRSSLKKYGTAIRREFKRRYGKSGSRRLNRFVTRLANEASARSNADRDQFCADASTMFKKTEQSRVNLAHLALHYDGANQLASAACSPLQTTTLQPKSGTPQPKR